MTVPWMIAHRPTVDVNRAFLGAAMLKPLDDDIVIVVAERFPVRAIPEQRLVAAVRNLMVDHEADAARVGLDAAVHPHRARVEQAALSALHAEGVRWIGKERRPRLLPCSAIASIAG